MVDFNPPSGSAAPRRIPSLPGVSAPTSSTSPTAPTSAADSASSGSTLRLPVSSISRKKPKGLSIASASRPAPLLPDGTPDLSSSGSGLGAGPSSGGLSLGGGRGISDAEQLRQDIERLQLRQSGRLSGTEGEVGSQGLLAPADGPASPAVGSTGEGRKKSASGTGKTKKRDKDAEDVVKDEDLEVLHDLGAGNGGTVTKVFNRKLGRVMAKKTIMVDAKPSVRKQILRELQIMSECRSPYIVGYYGCFPVGSHVGVVMEFMDLGSLDSIYREYGAVPIDIVGKIAEAVLRGLTYLYDSHRIIHRDIKPSNILANTEGQVKICDFGVSGELINSIANTFVGTSTYMSPERIQGAPYTIKSDVWSLGISLIELALGRFPFSDSADSASTDESGESTASEHEDGGTTHAHIVHGLGDDPDATLPRSAQRPAIPAPAAAAAGDGHAQKKKKRPRRKNRGVSLDGGGLTMSILDLLQHIVNEPAPRLVSARRQFPREAVNFVEGCLDKDPAVRKSPQDLLASAWVANSQVTQEDLKEWAQSLAD